MGDTPVLENSSRRADGSVDLLTHIGVTHATIVPVVPTMCDTRSLRCTAVRIYLVGQTAHIMLRVREAYALAAAAVHDIKLLLSVSLRYLEQSSLSIRR